MFITLRELASSRPGRLSLATVLLLTPLALLVAAVVAQSGAPLREAAATALLVVYFTGSVLAGALAMCVGTVLLLAGRFGAGGRGLMEYGAAMGVLGFAALMLASGIYRT